MSVYAPFAIKKRAQSCYLKNKADVCEVSKNRSPPGGTERPTGGDVGSLGTTPGSPLLLGGWVLLGGHTVGSQDLAACLQDTDPAVSSPTLLLTPPLHPHPLCAPPPRKPFPTSEHVCSLCPPSTICQSSLTDFSRSQPNVTSQGPSLVSTPIEGGPLTLLRQSVLLTSFML